MPESIPAPLIIDTLKDTFLEARAALAAEVAEPPMHTHLGWIFSVPDTHQKTVLAALDKKESIVHFLFKNGVYDTSGAQGIPGGLSVDFVMMARGAGYRMACAIDDLGDFERRLPELLKAEGPVLVELHTGLAEQTPMTVRERIPFHQQLQETRVRLLRPRASATTRA